MKSLLVALVFMWMQGGTYAQNIFHWKWQYANDSLQIRGMIDNSQKKTIQLHAAAVISNFRHIHRIVDEIEYNQWEAYKKTIDLLSEQVVRPFEKQLLQSGRIVVEIDSALLHLPFEFLQVRHQPIAVLRPLSFTINGSAEKKNNTPVTLHKGFILRDPTSDPEDACSSVFRHYPHSTFRSTHRISPDNLQLKPDIDFVLISAHGFADSITLRGCVFAEEEPIKPSFLQTVRPKLVYVDGCQQGINWSYIKALAKNDSAAFYLGPVVSNDSGESSTKTINWFFSYLRQTANPATALWQTRKKLYQHYNKRIHKLDVINKSFIFRVYSL